MHKLTISNFGEVRTTPKHFYNGWNADADGIAYIFKLVLHYMS